LQHDPNDILRFIEKLDEGYDIICGRRENNGSGLRGLSNYCANWVTARLTGVPIHDFGSGFKAYKRNLVSEIPMYGEMQRLIPVLAFRREARVCEIPITIKPRKHGVSKYGLSRKLPFLFDLLTVRFLLRYVSRPLHAFGTAGLLSFFVGSMFALWLVLSKLLYNVSVMQQHGPLMVASAVLIVAGIQLVAFGLLAEMQVRHFHQSQDRSAPYEVESVIRSEIEP